MENDISQEVPMVEEKINFELVENQKVENISCEEITNENVVEAIKLGEQMIKFCIEKGGVGLAAPQIGIYKKIFVFMFKENLFQIALNPQYFGYGKKINSIEGCLSYLKKNYFVPRWKEIRFVFYIFDKKNNKLVKMSRHLTGQPAIIVQHEIDHINGLTIAMKGQILENGQKD